MLLCSGGGEAHSWAILKERSHSHGELSTCKSLLLSLHSESCPPTSPLMRPPIKLNEKDFQMFVSFLVKSIVTLSKWLFCWDWTRNKWELTSASTHDQPLTAFSHRNIAIYLQLYTIAMSLTGVQDGPFDFLPSQHLFGILHERWLGLV